MTDIPVAVIFLIAIRKFTSWDVTLSYALCYIFLNPECQTLTNQLIFINIYS